METPTQILTKPYPESIRRFIDNDIVPRTDKKLFYADLKKLSIDAEQVLAEYSDVDNPDYGILADLADRINALLNKDKNINDMTVAEVKEAVAWLRKEASRQKEYLFVMATITSKEAEFRVAWAGETMISEMPSHTLSHIRSITHDSVKQAEIDKLKAQLANLERNAK